MARRYALGVWRRIATAIALLAALGLAASAEAGNTTGRTGKGATHDNSVYCQWWDGQERRPAYPGTGRQIPCGPNFGPPKPPPKKEEAGDSCPVRRADLLPGVVLAAVGAADRAGLWVADKKIESAAEVGLQGLTKRRKELFDRMRCHTTRAFRFANRQRLKDTIDLRGKIIERMEARYRPYPPTDPPSRPVRDQPQFSAALQPSLDWEIYPEPRASVVARGRHEALRAKAGMEAFAAVESARSSPLWQVDCQAGMQWVILDSAAEVLREDRFNALHPLRKWPHFVGSVPGGEPPEFSLVGLGVPIVKDHTSFLRDQPVRTTMVDNSRYTSIAKHLVLLRYDGTGRQSTSGAGARLAGLQGTIRVEDMVPGDYVYLRNVLRYPEVARQNPDLYGEAPAWAGENAFYLYEHAAPRTRSGREPVFAGFGLKMFMNEPELRQELADAFNSGRIFQVFGITLPMVWDQASPGDMLWTRLGGPTIDDSNPDEAGPFVR